MKIIAFTGAGISKSAGIPTFEEIEGIKDKLSVEFKNSHPVEFKEALETLKKNVKDKEPTLAHKLLAEYKVPIITMNVDGLHQAAGSKDVIEIHGNALKNNIVLYGQELLRSDDAVTLILKTANDAKRANEEAILLVIGTSMGTSFANIIVYLAQSRGIKVHFINQDADNEVKEFFSQIP